MLNFSEIPSSSVIGRILRSALTLIPDRSVVRVLQGPLRGARWIVGSSSHGCWLGSYEASIQREFQAAIRPGSVVYDVGANVGFYTLLSSRLTGPSGSVYAFEPAPGNIEALRRHISLNKAANVTLFPAAVSSVSGTEGFDPGAHRFIGRLSDSGTLRVEVVTLDELVAKGDVQPPEVIKIDVEGSELEVLRGAGAILERYHPVLLLATHSETDYDACCRQLRVHGYESLRTLVEEAVVIAH